jgi:hypothetical protein
MALASNSMSGRTAAGAGKRSCRGRSIERGLVEAPKAPPVPTSKRKFLMTMTARTPVVNAAKGRLKGPPGTALTEPDPPPEMSESRSDCWNCQDLRNAASRVATALVTETTRPLESAKTELTEDKLPLGDISNAARATIWLPRVLDEFEPETCASALMYVTATGIEVVP